jgi:hypothetical protein
MPWTIGADALARQNHCHILSIRPAGYQPLAQERKAFAALVVSSDR